MKTIVFRVDASEQIGSGHVMRCLTLAQRWKEGKADVQFICRDFPGNLASWIERQGFKVHRLARPTGSLKPTDLVLKHSSWLGVPWAQDAQETKVSLSSIGSSVDWLVIDHYGIDAFWQNELRKSVAKIMVIDDVADRRHTGDILLDQNLIPNYETRYSALVPASCRTLLGPRYAMLRKEFVETRLHLRQRNGECKRLLVFMGGADPDNATQKVLKVCEQLKKPDLNVDVVIGASNPFQNEIEAWCQSHPGTTLHKQVNQMSDLIANADIAVGAAGSSTWERCCLGLPSITLNIASNQDPIAEGAQKAGVLMHLGRAAETSEARLRTSLETLIKDASMRQDMSRKGMDLIDGLGVERVFEAMQ